MENGKRVLGKDLARALHTDYRTCAAPGAGRA
jgi:hypothetical protein